MPRWTPPLKWKNQDAIIIGGGPSLSSFDFKRLIGRNTIGCNDAYRLGPEIVQVCLFGDKSWWDRNKQNLTNFPNDVVTCSPSLINFPCGWLKQIARQKDGLHRTAPIGWNHNTGACAINLAIMLGAVRIFLLGFDLSRRLSDNKAHWHAYNVRSIEDESYRRFLKGFGHVYADLKKFPEVRVTNVTDGSSQLPFFPRISFDVFLKYVPPQNRTTCINCEERAKEAAQRRAA